MTRYDDVVWCLRHPELFSSEIFLRDARPPFPPILDTDHALYEFNKKYGDVSQVLIPDQRGRPNS